MGAVGKIKTNSGHCDQGKGALWARKIRYGLAVIVVVTTVARGASCN